MLPLTVIIVMTENVIYIWLTYVLRLPPTPRFS